MYELGNCRSRGRRKSTDAWSGACFRKIKQVESGLYLRDASSPHRFGVNVIHMTSFIDTSYPYGLCGSCIDWIMCGPEWRYPGHSRLLHTPTGFDNWATMTHSNKGENWQVNGTSAKRRNELPVAIRWGTSFRRFRILVEMTLDHVVRRQKLMIRDHQILPSEGKLVLVAILRVLRPIRRCVYRYKHSLNMRADVWWDTTSWKRW